MISPDSPDSSAESFDSLFDEPNLEDPTPSSFSPSEQSKDKERDRARSKEELTGLEIPSELSEPLEAVPIATREVPSIPGLYIFPSLVDTEVAESTLNYFIETNLFLNGTRNQIMLFPTPLNPLPKPLETLLHSLSSSLQDLLPPLTHSLIFNQQPLSRQVIINLYSPGEGITPHIDLPTRYADGILGVSLLGSTVFLFNHPSSPTENRQDVYLPRGSVYVLSGESRWEWEHGIEPRKEDFVEGVRILRDLRVSVTFRWMKEGADVLS